MAEEKKPSCGCKLTQLMANDECQPAPAGLGKLYFTTAEDKNLEHLQEVELIDRIDFKDIDIEDDSKNHWGDNGGKGYCITGTLKLENNKETRTNLQKLMRGQGRLPRKEKKRMRNSILRNKRALIFVLIATMMGYGTAFNDAAAFIFAGRPRTTDGEGHAIMQLNNAEWHAVDTIVRRLYKHRGTMLKRLWQRNRNLFPEV